MAFPDEQGGFLNALQSDLNDSVDLNQFDEYYTNISDEIYFPNAIDEEYMTNDWSINHNPDLVAAEHLAYASLMGGAYSEDIIHNQHAASVPSVVDSSYSSDFVQELFRSIRRVHEAFLAEAAMQFNANQLLFNITVNYNVGESGRIEGSEQEIEQARQRQFPADELVPLPIQMYQHAEIQQAAPPAMPASFLNNFNYETYFNEFGLIEPEDIQRINDSVFNGEEINDQVLGESQHGLLNDNEPCMFEDIYGDKNFSSWLLYGSDDDMATFKNILSEENSGDNPQPTTQTNTPITKPNTNVNDGSHEQSTSEHAVPGSGSQADGTSSNEKLRSELVNQQEKRAVQRPVSSLRTNQRSSHNQRHHYPVADDSVSFDFQDTIVRTSTPNNSRGRHSFIESGQATEEASFVRETRRSRYFVREDRNVSITKEKSSSAK
ncbi:unnamed protein product [Mucor circinelloides]